MSTFTLVNGGVVPRLNGSNFFGWHQAILDAAYAGGYITILNGKKPKPVDPSTPPVPVVKRESPVPVPSALGVDSTLRDAVLAAAGEEDIGEEGVEEEVITVNQRGTVISMDQKRREFLTWERQNFEAKSLLLKSVDSSFHWEIVDEELASIAWEIVCEAHSFNQSAVMANIRVDLRKLVLVDNGDMQAHLRLFGDLVERGIKSNMTEFSTDTARCDVFLESLPYTLNHIKREFRILPSSERQFRKLRALYLEEMREKESSAARQADVQGGNLFFSGRVRGGRGGRVAAQVNRPAPRRPESDGSSRVEGQRKPPLGKCFRCGQNGHWKRDCPSKERGTAAVAAESGRWSLVSVRGNQLLSHRDTGETTWVIDSGATHHLTGNRSILSNIRKLHYPVTFGTANQEQVTADAEGSVYCRSSSGVTFAINNVNHIKNGRLNILSLSTLLQRGWEVDFRSNEMKGHGQQFSMRQIEGLWTVTIQRSTKKGPGAVLAITEEGKTLKEWHQSLGHMGVSGILKLAESGVVDGLVIKGDKKSFKTEECDTCMISKSTRLSFGDSPVRAEKPLELIHSDLAGPLVMNKDGIQYYATVIDDYTGIINIGLLKTKNEVKDFLFKSVRWLEQQLDHKVRFIRTDGGKEYLGPAWDDFLRHHGIVHQVTTPYSPQLNGVAERMNRTLKEMAGAILRESHLPKECWVEAIGYVNTLLLQTRLVGQGKTAYEWLYRRKPKASELHPFGCEVYVHIPQENRLKNNILLPKAWKGILVGLPLGSTGYQILHADRGRKTSSRDLRFPRTGRMTFKSEEEKQVLDDETDSPTAVDETIPTPLQPEDATDQMTEEPPVEDVTTQIQPQIPSFTLPTAINKEPTEEAQSIQEEGIQEDTTPEIPRYSLRQRAPVVLSMEDTGVVSGDDRLPAWTLTVEGGINNADPSSYDEAIRSPQSNEWRAGIENEFVNMRQAETWTDAVLPKDRTLVGCKWVFKTKRDQHGSIASYKARIVAKGYSQIPGQDYEAISSPVARSTSLRIILTIAAKRNLVLGQMDFVAAFLNGILDRPIFMECPPGYSLQKGCDCVKLKKALYGLKQAGRTWWEALDQHLISLNFRRASHDWGVYIQEEKEVYLVVYVDDILIAGPSLTANDWIKRKLAEKWKMKDLGVPKFLLGIEIVSKKSTIELRQTAYIDMILGRFGMRESKTVVTPLESNLKLLPGGETCRVPSTKKGMED